MRNVRSLPDFSTVTVTGQSVDISEFSDTWYRLVTDLSEHLAALYRTQMGRFLIGIGGASGSSKSTAAAVLERLLRREVAVKTATVSLDGYHFRQAYLADHTGSDGEPLATYKGRYDTYDTGALKDQLKRYKRGESVSFPAYSRVTHEPVYGAIPFQEEQGIVLFEGLWALFDVEPWATLSTLYDYSIFFHTDRDFRRENTISRHFTGGKVTTREAAEVFYENSDERNAELLLAHIAPHDLDITIT